MVCPNTSVRFADVVLCVGLSPCRHMVNVALSVGPVRGAAVARLVDLALLLQAAGLAALARTTLDRQTHDCETLEEPLVRHKVLKKCVRALPAHPELDGDAAAGSVVAGEAGCGGMGPVHSLQELLQDWEALGPPVLMASWREEGSLHGNPAYQKTADGRQRFD